MRMIDPALFGIGLLLSVQFNEAIAFFFGTKSTSTQRPTGLDEEALVDQVRKEFTTDLNGEYYDYNFFLKWLQDEEYNVEKTVKRLQKFLSWYEEWNVKNLKDLFEPEEVKKYATYGLSGFDKDGCPVVSIQILENLSDFLDKHGRKKSTALIIKFFENYAQLAWQQSLKHGPAARKITFIVDLSLYQFNLDVFSLTLEPPQFARHTIHLLNSHYPDMVKSCYIINASTKFILGFKMFRNMLGKLKPKVHIFRKSNIMDARREIFEFIEADQLPSYVLNDTETASTHHTFKHESPPHVTKNHEKATAVSKKKFFFFDSLFR